MLQVQVLVENFVWCIVKEQKNNCGQINVAWFLVLLLSTCTTLFRLLLPVLLMPDLTDNKKNHTMIDDWTGGHLRLQAGHAA
jgi:hypothetical protein